MKIINLLTNNLTKMKMKKTTFYGRFKVILLLFLIVIFSSVDLFAEKFVINENGTTNLKVTENNYQILRLTNSLAEFYILNIKTEIGNFSELLIPGYAKTKIIGSPGLPVKRELIELPMDATPLVNILDYNVKEYNLTDLGITQQIIPTQPPHPKDGSYVEFQYDAEAYNQDKFYPEEIVTLDVLGMMRGLRIGRVNIAPVQYNPVTNTIRIIEDIDFKIVFKNANITKTKEYKKLNANIYFNAISKKLLNYKPLEGKELVTDAPAKYVIISDPMFESALQPFIEWKTKKGFVVIEAYTDDPNVGGTTTSIKNYLEDLYNQGTPDDPPPAFALIVGDVQQVPAFNGTTGGHVTDWYYYEYTGDWLPELYFGRFSAQNLGQLQPQIDKTLEYEQYTMPDPSYLNEVVMVAGMDGSHGYDWGNGQINYGTENYFNAAHGIISHTYLYPNSGSQSAQIIQDISDGVTYANYTAHCSSSGWADPSFTTSNIPSLQNDHEYGLWVGNCCSSSAYDAGECFAEAALRAVDKGAVGYIGGSNSTMWDPDYYWAVGVGPITEDPPSYEETTLGAYDCTFHDHGEPIEDWYITQAQMFIAGNIAVELGTPGSAHYYWEIYCLMGDPSLMIYFSQPPDATSNYQGLMPLGVATFTVNTDPYAYVAITKDGVLHGCAIADDTGLAEVNMFNPILVPGTADVVITGQNLKPFIGTVNVASPTGPYVLFYELQIDDSNGNNNGIVDFGENILLDVTLENMGSQTGTNLVATISTTDTNLIINNATHNWPDIAVGATSLQTGAFEFTVNDVIPDQHIVQFDLEVTDGTETWNSMFNITLNAPVLSIGNYYIDDSYGNNNGRLDPGETADIIIPNGNEGGCDALNSIASAIAASAFITVNTATFNLGTISAGASEDAIINITIDAAAQVGDIVNMDYTVESSPYSANTMIVMTIGLIVEDFESGGFNSYEWEFSGNADWTIDEVDPYEGVYCAKSGDINDDQTSVLMINVDVTADDQISFFRKVSSEEGWDYLKFYIDNVLKDEWSGENIPWEEISFPVTAGSHTFKWEYYKDGSVSNGGDCAWLDYIVFPPFAATLPLGVVASANPGEICEGESSQLNAFAMGGTGNYTYEWLPETGLNNPNISNPVATPDETTTYNVIVDDGENTVTGNVTVVVNPVPETPTITQQGNSLVSSAVDGNQWYNSVGLIPGATQQIYIPDTTDDYYVIVTNEFECESEPSNTIHFIYTGMIEIADGKKVNIYPNPFTSQFTLDYSLKSVSTVKISIFNIFGQQIHVIEEQTGKAAGNHTVRFDAGNLEPGVYYCKIETVDYSVVKRIIHSK